MSIVWPCLALLLLVVSFYAFKMHRGQKEKKRLIVRSRMMSFRRRHHSHS
ncbi:hypothetical protein [Nissabacter sp. SGAir0207]|nr:hypothetical protein [Nissabacter sp. SGAir0207]